MKDLNGNVALITGAGRGVGRAVAAMLARRGARLILNDLDEAPLLKTAEAIESAGHEVRPCAGSVTEDGFPKRFIEAAMNAFGRIDIIVNNAGFTIDQPIERSSDEEWDLIHGVNLRAPYRILREAAPIFQSTANETQQEDEHIRKVVNVASMAGTRGNARQSVYSAAKAGLTGLTRSLSKEWGRYKVNVNCVAFGMIDTRQTRPKEDGESVSIGDRRFFIGSPREKVEALSKMIPIGRLGKVEEAAGAICLLCLPEANYINGQIIEVGGGLSA